MARIDPVADRLADEVIADRPAVQAVGLEEMPYAGNITGFIERLRDIEVASPTGKLNAIEAHFPDFWSQLGERQIGPLAGKESDES